MKITPRYKSTYLFLLFLFLASGVPAQDEEIASKPIVQEADEQIQSYITHANTLYWLGIANYGDLRQLRLGLEYAQEAEEEVKKLNPSSEHKRLISTIENLQIDLKEQIDIAHDTLYGLLPYFKLYGRTGIFLPEKNVTYEMFDDPHVIASVNSINQLVKAAESKLKGISQIPVAVTADPMQTALVHEALYVFNDNPFFYPHTLSEVRSVLNEEEFSRYMSADLDGELIEKLARGLDESNLMVVDVSLVDEFDNRYFYVSKGYFYSSITPDTIQTITNQGFAIDRTDRTQGLVWAHVGLAGLAFALITIYVKKRKITGKATVSLFAFAGAGGFLIGRALPMFFFTLIMPLQPLPESLLVTSFWWPLLLGALVFLASYVIFYILFRKMTPKMETVLDYGEFLFILTPVSLGIAGWLLTGPLVYSPSAEVSLILSLGLSLAVHTLALSTLIAAGLGGRRKSRADRVSAAISLPAVLLGYLAMSFMTGGVQNSVAMIGAGLLALLGAGLILTITKAEAVSYEHQSSRETETDEVVSKQSGSPWTGEQLKILEDFPHKIVDIITKEPVSYYAVTDWYKQTREKVYEEMSNNKQNLWISLKGESGRGKSATAEKLIADIKHDFGVSAEDGEEKPRKEDMVFFSGRCVEGSFEGTGQAYLPFREAFESRSDAFTGMSSKEGQVVEKVAEIASSFFPIPIGLLFPQQEKAELEQLKKKQLHKKMVDWLDSNVSGSRVLILLEDLQWMDKDSLELLDVLNRVYGPDMQRASKKRFIFILTSRKELPKNLSITDSLSFDVGSVSTDEIEQTLHNRLFFSADTGKKLVEPFGKGKDFSLGGGGSKNSGALHRFFDSLVRALSAGRFRVRDGEIELIGEESPIDPEMEKVIRGSLEDMPKYKRVLECAACIGEAFDADVVARGLDIPRVDALEVLQDIETSSGFVYDVRESDDSFRFRSTFVYEVIRRNIGTIGKGPGNHEVPQLVREYHARIAGTLDTEQKPRRRRQLDIAKHYYAAGKRYAETAFDRSMEAAEELRKSFGYEDVRLLLENAGECLDYIEEGLQERIEKWIDFYLGFSHHAGIGYKELMSRLETYVNRNLYDPYGASCATRIKLARFYFEYAVDNDRNYFEKIKPIARNVIEACGPSKSNVAEGYQFLALSYKRDEQKYRENIETALETLDSMEEKQMNRENLLLKARILNSYARHFIHSSGYSKEEKKANVEKALEKSLHLKEKYGDKMGQAITYGAYGDHYFYNEEDYGKALEYYTRDEKISEEIGNIDGIATSASHAGGCHEKMGNHLWAEEKFREAYKYSESERDRFFATVGLMINSMLSDSHETEEIERLGTELKPLFKKGPWTQLEELMKVIKKKVPELEKEGWFERIAKHVEAKAYEAMDEAKKEIDKTQKDMEEKSKEVIEKAKKDAEN